MNEIQSIPRAATEVYAAVRIVESNAPLHFPRIVTVGTVCPHETLIETGTVGTTRLETQVLVRRRIGILCTEWRLGKTGTRPERRIAAVVQNEADEEDTIGGHRGQGCGRCCQCAA